MALDLLTGNRKWGSPLSDAIDGDDDAAALAEVLSGAPISACAASPAERSSPPSTTTAVKAIRMASSRSTRSRDGRHPRLRCDRGSRSGRHRPVLDGATHLRRHGRRRRHLRRPTRAIDTGSGPQPRRRGVVQRGADARRPPEEGARHARAPIIGIDPATLAFRFDAGEAGTEPDGNWGPTARNRRLVARVRRDTDDDLDRCELRSIDTTTGRLRWSRPIGRWRAHAFIGGHFAWADQRIEVLSPANGQVVVALS
jgi:hypothetical protein